jgi:hypothetical protein
MMHTQSLGSNPSSTKFQGFFQQTKQIMLISNESCCRKAESEDGRVVKATGLRSVGASFVGSNPTLRIMSFEGLIKTFFFTDMV